MRKRSKYRPKPVRTDTLAYVINGFLPLREAANEMTRLGLINHGALSAIAGGHGTRGDAINLSYAFIATASLAEIGTGFDWLPEIEQGALAIKAVLLRGHKTGRYVFTGLELQAANQAMAIHEAQMDHCTIETYERAIKRAKVAIDCGHARKVAKTKQVEAQTMK